MEEGRKEEGRKQSFIESKSDEIINKRMFPPFFRPHLSSDPKIT